MWWFFISMIFLIIFFVILPSLNNRHVENDSIKKMKENIYSYSGLNEDIYLQYVNNLDLFQKNISNIELSSLYFYKAIENLYDLQLSDQDFDFSEEIHQNAIIGEEILLNSSREQSTSFNPKYLNNKIE